jgi:stage II sporulation protein D
MRASLREIVGCVEGLSEARVRPVRAPLVLLLALLSAAPAVHAEELVRIAVGRFTGGVTITGAGIEARTDEGTLVRPKGPLTLRAAAKGVVIGGRTYPAEIVRVEGKGLLNLRGHDYRRRLEVRWRSYRGRPELLVVHPVPIETYVVGIVSSELPRKWPLEALKAQAVAARTYAIWQKYRRLDLPYHMESSVLDQVYHGAEREHPDALRAVAETYGQVLTHGRRPANAYFHSTCGGRTESAKEGWGSARPYLPGSECGFCKKANRYKWRADVTKAEVDKAFQRVLGEPVVKMRVTKKSKTGRAAKVVLEGKRRKKTITGADMRRLLGYTKLWSTWFTKLERTKRGWRVEGKGAGHGVGMCQWGARGMAEAGKTVSDILTRYYPGADLTRMY